VLGNAGNARIKGAEAQVIWAPLAGLEFTVGTNWLQTEIVKWNAAPGTADDNGNQLANAPKNTLNGTIRYAFPLGQSGLQLYVLGNANYEGAQFFSVSNNPQAYQAGYTLFNGRFGLQNGHWDVSAWGQNLGNKLYISQAYDNYPGIFPSSWFYAPPRTYGVSVRYDF
jgi:iron complex outermembrane recepter protein